MIAWTPPDSEGRIGSVRLRSRPLKALTPAEYRSALADRIDLLVGREDPRAAIELLRKCEEMEGLSIQDPKHLPSAGELLVENSEWIRERAAFPRNPVPRQAVQDEPETAVFLEQETLEAFLTALYLEHEAAM